MNKQHVIKHNYKRLWLLAMVGMFFLVLLFGDLRKTVAGDSHAAATATTITVSDAVTQDAVKRLGINLGAHTSFGASQLMKNRVLNPGFEATEYAMILPIADGATIDTFVAKLEVSRDSDTNELIGAFPEDFWNGADYEVLDGAGVGTTGKVVDFSVDADATFPYSLEIDALGTALSENDAIIVRKNVDFYYRDFPNHAPLQRAITADCDATLAPIPARSSKATVVSSINADPDEARPGSTGTQSLKLVNQQWSYVMDSYQRDGDCTAGKLLDANGTWHLSFWGKSAQDGKRLTIVFERNLGESDKFILAAIQCTMSDDWKEFSFDFTVGETPTAALSPDCVPQYATDWEKHTDGNHVLELKIGNWNDETEAWLDDVSLTRADETNATAFNDALVARLKELQPGILRNWGNQLGASLDNQLADQFGRKTNGYITYLLTQKDEEDEVVGILKSDYHFALPEFLELAREVDAEPWYVVPPTWSNEEWQNLADYLAAPADGNTPYADLRATQGQIDPWTDVFPMIHLEYGNELWNGIFNGAKLFDAPQMGRVADAHFNTFLATDAMTGLEDQFDLIIGSQHANSDVARQIDVNSTAHNSIAVAPYFAKDTPTAYGTDEALFYPLLADSLQEVSAIGKMKEARDLIAADTNLSIYEINFHTDKLEKDDDGELLSPMTLKERNSFVASLGGGLALPLHMLTYQKELGVIDQAAFTTLQYSVEMADKTYVRLWGLLRDLEGVGSKRPGWLGLELANKAINGDLITTTHSGADPVHNVPVSNGIEVAIPDMPLIRSFAYKDGTNYGLVLFNLDIDNERDVEIKLPESWADGSATIHELTSENIDDNNEESAVIAITTSTTDDFGENHTMTLHKHAMYVIQFSRKLPAPIVTAPDCGTISNNELPTFNWSDVIDATNYQFLLIDTKDSTIPIINTFGTPVATSTYTVTAALPDGTYSWRARGQDSDGTWGAWMSDCNYVVLTNYQLSPCNAILADNTPLLDWIDVTGATSYDYQVQLNSVAGWSSPVASGTTTSSSLTLTSQLSNTVYKWRVRPENAAWSNSCPMIIDAPTPPPPVLLSPACGTVIADTTPSFDWEDAEHATNYQFELFPIDNPTSPTVDTDGTALANSTYSISAPLADDQYAWRVRGENGPNNWGAWSTTCDLQIGLYELYLPLMFK